jgi:O-antigen/teichoic acid export membrane protein
MTKTDETGISSPVASGPAQGRGELGSLVRTGVRWKIASGVLVQVTRMITAVVIARLVTPAEFGLAALVLMFSGFASIATDLSLGSALVQRPSITEADRSTVFWTSATVGGLLTLACIGASYPVASFYGEPEVQPLLAVFSATFLLNGLATTQATLLVRDMQFRSLELRFIVATMASAVVGITAAAFGAGAWAIILQSLAYSAVSVVLLWIASSWRPTRTFSLASLRDLGGFGIKVLGAQIAWFANTATDTILIGRFLGPASVGAYSIAFNLMLFPLTRIVAPLRNVAFPAFSRVQNDRSALARGWFRATSITTAVVAPAMLGMMVVAPVFVPVILGDRWLDAVGVIQALCWVGLLLALQQVGGAGVLVAMNRPGTVLRFTLAMYAANVVAFVIGLHWGIVGVAVAYAIATTILTPIFAAIVVRALGTTLREYGRHVVTPLLTAAVMAVCVLAVRVLVVGAVPGALLLLLLIVVGVVVYLALCLHFLPDVVAEFRRLIPSPERLFGRPRRSPGSAG